MRLTTDAVIIREKNISGDDRVITALTKDRGAITAFVNGAKRLRSKNASATGLFCYSNITLFKNKDTYIVNEASAIEVFFDIRKDIEKLSLAQYFCEIFMALSPQEEPATEYVELLLRSFYNIVKGSRPLSLIKAVTELRLLCLSGYQPDLVACSACGEYEKAKMYFDKVNGHLLCSDCIANAGEAVSRYTELPAGVLAAMRHIVYSDMTKIFAFSLKSEGLEFLSDITEKYLLAQTDRTYKTLDFYYSVKNGII